MAKSSLEGIFKARRREYDVLDRDLKEDGVELLEVEDDLKTFGAVDPDEMQKAQERQSELARLRINSRPN